MTIQTAYNGTTGPVVIDGEGRTLGGGEWGPVESTDDAVKAAIDAGTLVLVKAPAKSDKDLNPAAVAGFEATAATTAGRKATTEEL